MKTATIKLGLFFYFAIFLICCGSDDGDATSNLDKEKTPNKDAPDLDAREDGTVDAGIVTEPGEEQSSEFESSRFEIRDDGTVFDRSAGLTWMRCPLGLSGDDCDQGILTMIDDDSNDASPACEQADVAGYHDWRLPEVWELVLLVDYARAAPSIDEAIFPGTPVESFLAVGGPYGAYFIVSFYRGEVYPHYSSDLRAVRCVRGDFAAQGPLTMMETDKETVLRDEATGLIWMSCPADYELAAFTAPPFDPDGWPEVFCEYVSGSKGFVEHYGGQVYDYWEAREFCSNTDYGGFDDWRLPTVSEVFSLPVNDFRASPLTSHLYPGGPSLWTGESIDEQLGLGYAASVDNGFEVELAVLDDDRFVMLCVR